MRSIMYTRVHNDLVNISMKGQKLWWGGLLRSSKLNTEISNRNHFKLCEINIETKPCIKVGNGTTWPMIWERRKWCLIFIYRIVPKNVPSIVDLIYEILNSRATLFILKRCFIIVKFNMYIWTIHLASLIFFKVGGGRLS